MEQIEIRIDMKTEAKAKKVMSKLKLRSILKAMVDERLITGYEVTHWSSDGGIGIGATILSSTETEEEDE